MPETPYLEQFLSLSAALTGLDRSNLRPRNTPLDIAEQYLYALEHYVSHETTQRLLNEFGGKASSLGSTAAAAEILKDEEFGPIARSVIKLWLLSTWYDPAKPNSAIRVISSQAYKEGLIWKIMQAHPIGYSMWSFGYWADDPPALKEFLSEFKPSTP